MVWGAGAGLELQSDGLSDELAEVGSLHLLLSTVKLNG
jgi:hypothetical protein